MEGFFSENKMLNHNGMDKGIKGRVVKTIFIIITIGIVILYLLSALNPYVHNREWWFISLAGIVFPHLSGVLILLIIGWLFFNWRWSIGCIIVLLIGWKSILAVFSVPLNKAPGINGGIITVMSYNVHQFKPVEGGWDHGREKFWNAIIPANPDILCLQEFNTSDKKHFMGSGNLQETAKALGMRCAYFSKDHYYYDSLEMEGTVIFTRFPVIDSGRIKYDELRPSSVIYADLLVGTDTIRVMTTHLQSYQLEAGEYRDMARIKRLEPGMGGSAGRIIDRFRNVILIQNRQAVHLSEIIKQSPYPVILCGDFNSTPDSFVYFTINKCLIDAFIKSGSGLGGTYSKLSGTLRIDYIFTDPRFGVSSFEVKKRLLSDHYPVVARITLPAFTED